MNNKKIKKWLKNAAKEIAVSLVSGVVFWALFIIAEILLVRWLG